MQRASVHVFTMDMRLEDRQSRAANSLAYSWPKQCSYIIKGNNLISRLLYREWLPEQNSLKGWNLPRHGQCGRCENITPFSR
ncbi:hypothetical protein D5086_003653 [Populus alba]|uniref:Uncharacterized protein n=1 Tax=Populus alba TaxID=43335 RepID=A0ACC4D664_POPAL